MGDGYNCIGGRGLHESTTTTMIPTLTCGRSCQIATETTDCGGTCGRCEYSRKNGSFPSGYYCTTGSPIASFCGRRCSWTTEKTDCGGTCGLCDGYNCIRGSPLHQSTTTTMVPTLTCGRSCQIAAAPAAVASIAPKPAPGQPGTFARR